MLPENLPVSDETTADLSALRDSLQPQLRKDWIELREQADRWRSLLRQANERPRLAMDLGCLGIWEWSIPDNRITREGYHEELLGLPPGTFAGTYEGFLACVHPEDRECVQREIDRCLTS